MSVFLNSYVKWAFEEVSLFVNVCGKEVVDLGIFSPPFEFKKIGSSEIILPEVPSTSTFFLV